MRAASFLLVLSLSATSRAQTALVLKAEGDANTVMVRGFASDAEGTVPLIQATWRFAADTPCTFAYQRLSSSSGDRSLTLRELMLAGMEQYLDQRIHFAKLGVHTDVSDEHMLKDLNAMAATAAREFGVSEAFFGCSEPTMEQLERVTHIDWSQATFGVNGGQDQDKYLAIYYYVRSQRQELERQLRADLMTLAAVDVVAPADIAAQPGHSLRVPTVCSTVYDDQNFLCALDLTVSDTLMAVPDARLTDQLMLNLASQAKTKAALEPQVKVRKRDRWLKSELDKINTRIDQLDQRKELWALRDRMDDMEGRVEDLGLEVQEIKANGGAEPTGRASENPIANLSSLTGVNVTIRFERNSTEVDADFRVVLNEVFEQLARAPMDRVLITGFTDKSGDTAMNLALSEQRAKAVRAYLMQRGIAPDRLMVNYYGDSRSSGRDPNERRVEIEWLTNP